MSRSTTAPRGITVRPRPSLTSDATVTVTVWPALLLLEVMLLPQVALIREPMARVRAAVPPLTGASLSARVVTAGRRSVLRLVSVDAASRSPRLQAVRLVRANMASRLFLTCYLRQGMQPGAVGARCSTAPG